MKHDGIAQENWELHKQQQIGQIGSNADLISKEVDCPSGTMGGTKNIKIKQEIWGSGSLQGSPMVSLPRDPMLHIRSIKMMKAARCTEGPRNATHLWQGI